MVRSMAQILCSVLVPGDPETIFDYVSDSEHHALWQRDLLMVDAPAANLIEGSSWTEVRKLGSRNLYIDVTVTEAVRPQRIAFVGQSSNFRGEGVLEFHAEGSRTRIVHRTEFSGRGIRAALAPLVARRAQQIVQANLFRLTFRLAQAVA
jgi:uncharacterized protein YndB with AHSA1/START domain